MMLSLTPLGRWLYAIALTISAAVVYLALFAVPFVLAYAAYRPFEKKQFRIAEQIRIATTDHARARHEQAAADHAKRQFRDGVVPAVLAFGVGLAWSGFVMGHWNAIGRLVMKFSID